MKGIFPDLGIVLLITSIKFLVPVVNEYCLPGGYYCNRNGFSAKKISIAWLPALVIFQV